MHDEDLRKVLYDAKIGNLRGCAPNIEELARADTRGVLSQLLHKQIGANMFKVMAESLL